MKIKITRYYGDNKVTKSLMQVYMAGNEVPALTCEAREPKFCSYSETFPGWTSYCMPMGVMYARIRPTEVSPLTIALGPSPRRCKTLIAWNANNKVSMQRIMVGEADENVLAERRMLVNQERTFERLTELARRAYVLKEDVVVEIAEDRKI